MLNDVTMIGFIAGNSWRVRGDLYFRLACYRDPQRPQKRSVGKNGHREEPDYVTCCLPLSLFTVPPSLKPGMLLRVSGYLVSEYYNEPLERFLKNAQGPTGSVQVSDLLRRDVYVQRVSNTFMVERFNLETEDVRTPHNSPHAQTATGNGQRPAPATPAQPAPASATAPASKKKKNGHGQGVSSAPTVPAPVAAPVAMPTAVAAEQS